MSKLKALLLATAVAGALALPSAAQAQASRLGRRPGGAGAAAPGAATARAATAGAAAPATAATARAATPATAATAGAARGGYGGGGAARRGRRRLRRAAAATPATAGAAPGAATPATAGDGQPKNGEGPQGSRYRRIRRAGGARRGFAGKMSMRLSHKDDPDNWRCDAMTCKEENSEAFAGQHAADSTSCYLFDKASRIPDIIWDVAGVFCGA